MLGGNLANANEALVISAGEGRAGGQQAEELGLAGGQAAWKVEVHRGRVRGLRTRREGADAGRLALYAKRALRDDNEQALIGEQVKAGVAVRMAVLYELLVGSPILAAVA